MIEEEKVRTEFRHWSDLFDYLIIENDQGNESDFVSRFCQATGRTSRRDLETISRNISNWRYGNHLPSRKNFNLLSSVLGVAQDAKLSDTWQILYNEDRRARNTATNGKLENKRSFWDGFLEIFAGIRLLAVGVAFLATASIIAVFSYIVGYQNGTAHERENANHIPFRPDIILGVGEQAVIHGIRGKCGSSPPGIDYAKGKLPKNIEIGALSIGRIGNRYSRSCNGMTPAREVVFHAKKAGVASFVLFDDDMTVTVKN